MKKAKTMTGSQRIQVGVFGLILALLVFGGVYLFSKDKNATKSTITTAKCDQAVTCIYLKDKHAEPDVITVTVGSYVQVNSADGQTHDIASGSGDEHHDGEHIHTEGVDSGNFKADEAWKVQFNQTGTFDFHDHYHPEIYFTVVVYKPGADYKIKS